MKAVLEDKNTGHACGGERSIIVGGEDVGGEDSGGGPLSLSLNRAGSQSRLMTFCEMGIFSRIR